MRSQKLRTRRDDKRMLFCRLTLELSGGGAVRLDDWLGLLDALDYKRCPTLACNSGPRKNFAVTQNSNLFADVICRELSVSCRPRWSQTHLQNGASSNNFGLAITG